MGNAKYLKHYNLWRIKGEGNKGEEERRKVLKGEQV